MPKQSTFIDHNDGYFRVQSDGESLFELAPGTMGTGYRFRAELRHENSKGGFGSIGVYIAHTQFVSKNGTGHEFYFVDFNDLVPEPEAKQNRLRLHRADCFEPGMHGIVRGMGTDWNFTPTGVGAGPTWHELRMEWGKAGLAIHFDGEQAYRMPRHEVAIYTLLEDDRFEIPDIPLTMQGGLGIYVTKSTVCIRRVHLEPIVE
jgi:hypothetical protein